MNAVVAGWRALAHLVLPATCAGCDADGRSVDGRSVDGRDVDGWGAAWRDLCDVCAAGLASGAVAPAEPVPRPPGLPAVTAAGRYDGPLRQAIIAYKDRGRHPLAAALGDRLAAAVLAATAVPGAAAPPGGGGGPVLLIPVPATAAAARRRYGDHMTRLARRAAIALRRRGVPVAVAYPLRARPRPDFAGLSAVQRHRAAARSFALRPRRLPPVRAAVAAGVRPVLVDDVVTTGATLTAAAGLLRAAGVPVEAAAVLAATARQRDGATLSHRHLSVG